MREEVCVCKFCMSDHHVIASIRTLKVLMRLDSCCFTSKFYRKDLKDEPEVFGMSSDTT